MQQLATVFEKIREDFLENHGEYSQEREIDFIFSPFTTGFTQDDFLFLDTNNASDNVHNYLDELYEFSQIANTIPRSTNFWTISGNPSDYLYNPYKTILRSLRLLDTDTLTAEMLYDHSLFDQALAIIDLPEKETYIGYLTLFRELQEEVKQAEEEAVSSGEAGALSVSLKLGNLEQVEADWNKIGHRALIESEIVGIVKDEFNRFLNRLSDSKSRLQVGIREHLGSGSSFYLTYCLPNNLYRANELQWKKISLTKSEMQSFINNGALDNYRDVVGDVDEDGLEIDQIDFELLFVNVSRAWYDEQLLKSPFWDIRILNKDEIAIPNVTSQLIFIRNMDIKLPANSQKNEAFMQKNTEAVKSVGPFVMAKMAATKGKGTFRMASFNKTFDIKRDEVIKVASKLQLQQKKEPKTNARLFMAKEQQQFKSKAILQMASSVKTRSVVQASRRPAVAETRRPAVRQRPTKTIVPYAFIGRGIMCEFIFRDARTNKAIRIPQSAIKVYYKGKQIGVSFKRIKPLIVSAKLKNKESYVIVIDLPNYKKFKRKILVKGKLIKPKPMRFVYKLTKEVKPPQPEPRPVPQPAPQPVPPQPEPEEAIANPDEFQLIGVIAQKLPEFPNPIEKATYI